MSLLDVQKYKVFFALLWGLMINNKVNSNPSVFLKGSTSLCVFSPQFLLSDSFFFLSTNSTRYSYKTIFVSRLFWVKFFFLSKLQIPCLLTYIVDGIQYKPSSVKHIVSINLNNMLSDDRLTVVTSLPVVDTSLTTLSNLFLSTTWLERELSDFSGITFSGLVDTRRLLLDYFEDKQIWQTHVSNDKNFNNTFYDSFLSF